MCIEITREMHILNFCFAQIWASFPARRRKHSLACLQVSLWLCLRDQQQMTFHLQPRDSTHSPQGSDTPQLPIDTCVAEVFKSYIYLGCNSRKVTSVYTADMVGLFNGKNKGREIGTSECLPVQLIPDFGQVKITGAGKAPGQYLHFGSHTENMRLNWGNVQMVKTSQTYTIEHHTLELLQQTECHRPQGGHAASPNGPGHLIRQKFLSTEKDGIKIS